MCIDTEELRELVVGAYLCAKECWDVSESYRTSNLAKKTIEQIQAVLVALGYTKHEVSPVGEEPYWVAIHPEYVELFKNGYFDPDLGIPEWAVIVL